MNEKSFISFEQKQLTIAEAEEKKAAEAAVQKLSMARQNLTYQAFCAQDAKSWHSAYGGSRPKFTQVSKN